MLSSTLATEGYAPTIVYNGEDAITFALREQPQLILLDLMLPGIDGFDVVSAIRANARTNHIPVVVLTARHDASVKLRAFASQVDDYMTKPFDGAELLARIRTQLRHLRETLLYPSLACPLASASNTPSPTNCAPRDRGPSSTSTWIGTSRPITMLWTRCAATISSACWACHSGVAARRGRLDRFFGSYRRR